MPYKVIIADASPSVQKVVQMAFPEWGFEIYPFEDGHEVLESLDRINPDAVLVSLSLAGRDGYDVGAFLKSREEYKQTTLVLLRGTFEPLDHDRLAGLDYDKIVQKPFDSEGLAETVLEIVDKKKCPATLPEELILEEPPAVSQRPDPDSHDSATGIQSRACAVETGKSRSGLPTNSQAAVSPPPDSPAAAHHPEDFEAKIMSSIREEIMAVERELEKRLSHALSAQLKEHWEREKAGIPPKD